MDPDQLACKRFSMVRVKTILNVGQNLNGDCNAVKKNLIIKFFWLSANYFIICLWLIRYLEQVNFPQAKFYFPYNPYSNVAQILAYLMK